MIARKKLFRPLTIAPYRVRGYSARMHKPKSDGLQRRFSFALEEGKVERWKVRCTSEAQRGTDLQCRLSRNHDERTWTFAENLLGTTDKTLTLSPVERSGYIVRDGRRTIAAIDLTDPGRLTVSSSVNDEDRSVLAAVTAALLLHEGTREIRHGYSRK